MIRSKRVTGNMFQFGPHRAQANADVQVRDNVASPPLRTHHVC
jgi:hypothetical protein